MQHFLWPCALVGCSSGTPPKQATNRLPAPPASSASATACLLPTWPVCSARHNATNAPRNRCGCRDATAFRSNLSAAHALWGQLAEEVRGTDLEAAEAEGDTSLRVCLAKLQVI